MNKLKRAVREFLSCLREPILSKVDFLPWGRNPLRELSGETERFINQKMVLKPQVQIDSAILESIFSRSAILIVIPWSMMYK